MALVLTVHSCTGVSSQLQDAFAVFSSSRDRIAFDEINKINREKSIEILLTFVDLESLIFEFDLFSLARCEDSWSRLKRRLDFTVGRHVFKTWRRLFSAFLLPSISNFKSHDSLIRIVSMGHDRSGCLGYMRRSICSRGQRLVLEGDRSIHSSSLPPQSSPSLVLSIAIIFLASPRPGDTGTGDLCDAGINLRLRDKVLRMNSKSSEASLARAGILGILAVC